MFYQRKRKPSSGFRFDGNFNVIVKPGESKHPNQLCWRANLAFRTIHPHQHRKVNGKCGQYAFVNLASIIAGKGNGVAVFPLNEMRTGHNAIGAVR